MKKFGKFPVRLWLASIGAAALVGCGGGGGGNAPTAANPPGTGGSNANQVAKITYPADDNDARRFLTQATFGPNDAAVADVKVKGFEPWIDEQINMAQASRHATYFDARDVVMKAAGKKAEFNEVVQSFWYGALTAPDQLRQRVAFALSEIFVVSGADGCAANNARGTVSYLDMLADNAFADYRTLLEKVAMHPVMGCYLSTLKNQRENTSTGRVPDENFAREIMQLFSIGLYQLNADGTPKLDALGNSIETYSATDIAGLAKVFTGFSWDCPDWPADNCFLWGGVDNASRYRDYWERPMVGYPQYHSYLTGKTFLGQTIVATTRPQPEADLKTALDYLALSHPNVGPFIGKQLIQRLVTSNPSAAYVGRVTAAFEASGRNMGAMIKAILIDPEARAMATATVDASNFGKVREPILRLTALLRAVGASSDSGAFIIDGTDDATTLSQTPLKAPSVFNFFRPGYVFPGGAAAAKGMVTPEMQIVNESSYAGYVNFMTSVVAYGTGRWQANAAGVTRFDIQMPYNLSTGDPWYVAATQKDSTTLIDLVNTKLMYGTMSDALRSEVKSAVESITLSTTPSAAQVRNRLWSALLLTVASPEFIVQK